MREVIKTFSIPCFALPSDNLQDQNIISHDENCTEKSSSENFSCSTHAPLNSPTCNSLFAFPAQCNFSGEKYPLEWISASQNGKLSSRLKSEHCINCDAINISGEIGKSDWYCLLDAASYVATNPLGEANLPF